MEFAFTIVLSLSGLILLCVAILFYGTTIRLPRRLDTPETVMLHPNWKPLRERIEQGRAWLRSQEPERMELIAGDGVRLIGDYIPAQGSRNAVLLMHGYHSHAEVEYGCQLEFYHSLGLNILLVQQRAHGASGGRRITFGVKERYDCRLWSEFLARRLGQEGKILLAGASMGAATVLLAMGLELPEQVCGVIADSGFTSQYEELYYLLKREKIPFPRTVMRLFCLASQALGRWNINEISVTEIVAQTALPLLFLCGEEDRLVPPEMSRINFEACTGEKYLEAVPEAGHCLAYPTDTERCEQAISSFVKSALSAQTEKAAALAE